MSTKFRKKITSLAACVAMLGLAFSSGCGGGSGANVITISLGSSSGSFLIVGQSTTLTATVSGATNMNVNWETPQYTTTTTNSNGTTTTSTATNIPTDGSLGTISNEQATGTATFTAPNQLPSPTKYPGLQIIITVQSAQNTNKTQNIHLTIESGITLVLTPTTASVPVSEPQQFSVQLTNDLQNKGATWAITQQDPALVTPTSGATPPNPYYGLATCSPSCGTITPDPNTSVVATFTAPSAVPTAITPAQKNNVNPVASLTIVATAVADPTRYVVGTITVIPGGPITFNTITPTIAPQGATFWDIYLDAPNISSASTITLTDSHGGTVPKLSSSGQVKILFNLPTTTTTTTSGVTTTTTVTGPPIGARLRLLASDLATAGSVTLSVTDPAQTVTAPNPPSAYTYTITPVRPTSIATVPDSVVQGKLAQNTPVTVDGGYFGPSGNLAEVVFQGTAISQDPTSSTSSNLVAELSTSNINSANPGLYPLSVASRATPLPTPYNPSVTNIALFPDYSVTPPAVTSGGGAILAGTNPTAVDLDPQLRVLVVAETGANAVQFYQIAPGSLTPIGSTGAACGAACPVAVGKVPTGLSVNPNNHTVAIVNYQDQSVTVLPIPGAAQQAPGTPFTVDISGALQNSITPAPLPYSIGVDPDTNLAIVAYSSTSASSASNLGFVVNLNPDSAVNTNPYGCLLDHAINSSSTKLGQCLLSQVTLNTGAYPQVAMSRHGHVALVTPGGSGVVRGVDVTKQSTGNEILSASLAAGLVTVTISTTDCPLGVPTTGTSPNFCPLSMVPGNAGTVLITGLPKGANGTNFNGIYTVAVLSSNSFSYALNSTVSDSVSGNCQNDANNVATVPCSTVFYGTPDQIFSISATAQGIAINPVTNTAAFADVNATGTNGPQLDLLSSLDQTVSSISFSANCTAFIVPCGSSPELLPTADVAWQPFLNEIVSYNPHLNQVSVSDPVSRQRYAFACEIKPAPAPQSCITDPVTPGDQQNFFNQITLNGTGTAALTVQNGTTNSLNLYGGLAVDPDTNQAFVVMSGTGYIDIVNLGGPGTATPIKPTHISEVLVPSPTPGFGIIGGLPGGLVPQATLTSANPLSGVQIFGTGFAPGLQVLLDGVDITTTNPPGSVDKITPNGLEVDVTIPPAFLSVPHHYSLQVLSSGAQSNSVDFIVMQAIDMSKICAPANSMPTSVAIADQLANGPFSPIAVVSNQGCNSVSIIDINPASKTFGQLIGSPITVGTAPQGIAISQRRGLAVVANNGSGTASIIDLTKSPPVEAVPDVSTGTNPVGVAINDPTGVAIVANNGSNTVTALNFALLYPVPGSTTAPPTTLTPVSIGGIQQPLAVAIDPDRGQNNQGIAVVTSVQLSVGSAPIGALAVVEIGAVTPALSGTTASGSVSGTPTGIVFDPAVITGTANPGVFFANSSGTNTISEFNPDTSSGSSVNVGINPTSLALNPQTGALLTSNTASTTASVVDISSNPFKTQQTLGIPGSPTFGVAIDQFTNLAVIVDQANQRVLLFPMPN